ncbi:MAG: signal recognition particle protein [Planctomycetota bacterium]|jgi:signal recognition particle subunit SRP54|nr:signal recognition particle protein [Planctomycetota bacterium]
MFDSLTAALAKALDVFRGQRTLTEENVQEGLKAVRQALLEADVHFRVAKRFVKRVQEQAVGQELIKSVEPGQQFTKICHDQLTEMMGPEAATLPHADSGPTVVMMAGLQGSGKTTTCAKLAFWYRKRKKKKPLLVAADLQRPAAVEQLVQLGKQLGIDVYQEGTKTTPPEVCQRGVEHAKRLGYDFVILDTAGRLHIDDALMAELEKVVATSKPHAVVLVCDSMTGQDAVNSAQEFHARLPLTGVVLTKLDGDTRGGAAMSVKEITGCPVLFAGVGEKVDDLEEFHPDRMAGRILGMGDVVGLVEKAQEVVDEKEAERAAKKMMKGRFTFNDFLKQLQMVKKLGPLKKVMGMLPGVGQAIKDIDVDDKQFARLEAMILSMTVMERRKPDVIDLSRRRRIARGSGNELQAVHNLIKQFKHMQKMFGKLGKGGQLPPELGGGAPRKGFRSPKGLPGGGRGFPTRRRFEPVAVPGL